MKRKKNIWEGLIIGIFIFLVIVPILTMRLFDRRKEAENRSGSYILPQFALAVLYLESILHP